MENGVRSLFLFPFDLSATTRYTKRTMEEENTKHKELVREEDKKLAKLVDILVYKTWMAP